MKIVVLLTSALVAFHSTAIAVEIPKTPIDSPARSAFYRQALAKLTSCKAGLPNTKGGQRARKSCDRDWVRTVQPNNRLVR